MNLYYKKTKGNLIFSDEFSNSPITRFLILFIILSAFFSNSAFASFCIEPEPDELAVMLEDEAEMMLRQYDSCLKEQMALKQVAESWKIEKESKFIPVSVGSVFVPIVTSEVYVQNPKVGKFTVRGDVLHSVSVNSVYQAKAKANVTFRKRPTLYVSIPGFKMSDVSTDAWQKTLEEEIRSHSLKQNQYYHMQVAWDSDENMYDQVKDLGDHVNAFLDEKNYKWDVVLIGFSRGGIFAHHLGDRIRKSKNMNNLLTVLLDPTAAQFFGDDYPTSGIKVSNANHYGYLYYDNEPWTCEKSYSCAGKNSFTTISDQKIRGYTNNGRHDFNTGVQGHEEVVKKFVNNTGPGGLNLSILLRDLDNLKPIESFSADGLTGYDVVKISRNNIQLNGELTIDDGRLRLLAEVDLGKLGSAGFDLKGDKNGVELGASTLVIAAYMQVNKDRLAVSSSIVVADVGASLDKNGLAVNYDALGIIGGNAKADLGEFAMEIEIFGTSIDLQFNTGKFVVSVGKEFGRALKNIGDAATGIVKGIGKLFGL